MTKERLPGQPDFVIAHIKGFARKRGLQECCGNHNASTDKCWMDQRSGNIGTKPGNTTPDRVSNAFIALSKQKQTITSNTLIFLHSINQIMWTLN